MSVHVLRRSARRYGLGDFGSSIPPLHPTVTAWAARVVVNGGANPSRSTQNALSTFCYGLDSNSLTSLMVSVCVFVNDSLTAAVTPLIKNSGNDPWTNNGPFVGGDLTVNGLVGNGTSKYLDSGCVPNTCFASDNTLGYTLYNYAGGATNAIDIGIWSAGTNDALYFDYSGTTYFDCHNSANGRINAANGAFIGYISANRTSSTVSTVYKASSTVPHVQLVTGGSGTIGTRATVSAYVFAAQNGGSPGTPVNSNPVISSKRFSFAAIHQGFTAAQSLAFYTLIQAMRTSLGGGFV